MNKLISCKFNMDTVCVELKYSDGRMVSIDALDDFHVNQDIIDEIYSGFDGLVSKTNKKIKSAFFRQALEVMNEKLPSEKVQEIFEANACCKSGAREKNCKEFTRLNANLGIADRLKLISLRPYLNMGSAELDENGYLIVHAVSYHPGEKFECACPTVSKIKRDYAIPNFGMCP